MDKNSYDDCIRFSAMLENYLGMASDPRIRRDPISWMTKTYLCVEALQRNVKLPSWVMKDFQRFRLGYETIKRAPSGVDVDGLSKIVGDMLDEVRKEREEYAASKKKIRTSASS